MGKIKPKNRAAVSLARLRMKKMTPAQRSAVASKAGKARMKALNPQQRRDLAARAGRAKGKGR